MTDQIISRDLIRRKAREDFARGAGRDDHGFNWHSPAIATWQEEWDWCALHMRRPHVRILVSKVSPP
jgi:hypothetical protein